MLKALKEKLTPVELAWVLYDVGNSAFTMLSCSLIPIWFKSLAIGDGPGRLSSDDATGTWALGVSLVTVIVALMGPVCGALSDRRDMKLIFFRTSVFIGVAGCIMNGLATGWVLFLVVFIISKIAYSCSLTFYDSMLGDVTDGGAHGRGVELRLRLGLHRLLHPLPRRAGVLHPRAGHGSASYPASSPSCSASR